MKNLFRQIALIVIMMCIVPNAAFRFFEGKNEAVINLSRKNVGNVQQINGIIDMKNKKDDSENNIIINKDDNYIVDSDNQNKDNIISVYNVNQDKVFNIEIEEYVAGVVAGEMPASFEMEALKAQAVTARTYMLYQIKKHSNSSARHPEASICTSSHCQMYYTKKELIDKMGQDWYDTYWNKIKEAVKSTKGQILTYDGMLVEPLFHSTSGGRTENSEDVFVSYTPYLRSVESPYEDNSPKFNSSVIIQTDDFISKIRGELGVVNLSTGNLKDEISLLEISEGGKIKSLQVGTKVVSGVEFRKIFGLNSANFRFVQGNNSIEIITTGYGHGVGMSQYGANGMAIEGYNYEEILKHYYTGVKIDKYM